MARHRAWLFAWALAIAAPAAQAQGYFGAGLGTTSSDIWDGIGCGPGNTCTFDDSDTGFKIFGGSRLTPNFAVEAFYADLGEATASETDGVTTASIAVDASALGVAAAGFLPLSDDFELLGKFGLAMWDADMSASITGVGSGTVNEDGTDPFFGLGIQWAGSGGFSIRGEFERFELDDVDLDMISINAIFSF